jgi:3-hydroxyisobutyrate dehydrogenase/glyoxylate/succinic semialdehyde reductase
MVSHPQAVRAVALGEAGFLEQLKSGALWVDCTTTNPSFALEMAAAAAQRQVRFLDAPVAGTKGPAEEGKLLFLVGGDPADAAACQPYFEAMGRKTLHVGLQGQGTALKMVLNMLLATAMLGFAEGVALGRALGLEHDLLLDTLLDSAVVPQFIRGKRAKLESNLYEADFPLKWMYKDLQMAAQAAYDYGASMPMENSAKEIYALAARKGLGDLDFSAIFKFMNETEA